MSFLRVLPPLSVLAVSAGICYWIFWSEPEPRKFPQRETLPKVSVERIEPESYQVWLDSQGTVQARTESTLISEARGKVISVSPSFRAGGFFEEGEILLEIDPRDYATAVVTAKADLARAKLALVEEQASAEQASVDWKRLNPNEDPPDLVSRKPQLEQARANADSAEAQLANAELNLERTRIAAPYVGRILSTNVDIGQFVSTGNILAQVYAVDYAEIRLPLSEKELGYIDLPESYRGEPDQTGSQPLVLMTTTLGKSSIEWEGKIVRAEGAFDTRSRQLFMVAQVDDPYGKRIDGRPPLKVGSFVQAKIKGKILNDVFVIPRKFYRKNEYIVIIDENNQLRRREIEVEWSDEESLVISSGLKAGERMCLTPLSFPSEGMKVAVIQEDGVDIAQDESSGKPRKERSGS